MGEALLEEIAEATGLPREIISSELNRLITEAGQTPSNLTMEQLRLILARYVQDVLVAAKQNINQSES